MGTSAGYTSGLVNPFNVGVAQGIAGLPMFSGIGLRIVIWVITVILVLIIFASGMTTLLIGVFSYGWYLTELSAVFFAMGIISGLAATTMPIMCPLADVLGLTRQTAVLAFQFGDGITNYITPTSGILMANLLVAKIPYEKWVKFIWPLIVMWTLLGVLFVVYASLTNYGPF